MVVEIPTSVLNATEASRPACIEAFQPDPISAVCRGSAAMAAKLAMAEAAITGMRIVTNRLDRTLSEAS
jgi:hypothetical protein